MQEWSSLGVASAGRDMPKGGRIAGAMVILGCCITIAGALLLWFGISEEGRLKTLLDDNPLHIDADLTRARTYEGTLGKIHPYSTTSPYCSR